MTISITGCFEHSPYFASSKANLDEKVECYTTYLKLLKDVPEDQIHDEELLRHITCLWRIVSLEVNPTNGVLNEEIDHIRPCSKKEKAWSPLAPESRAAQ